MQVVISFLLAITVIVSIPVPVAAQVDPIKWLLFPADCVPEDPPVGIVAETPDTATQSNPATPLGPPPGLWAPAGRYGVFYFGGFAPDSCAGEPLAWGVEVVPAIYPPPGNPPPASPCSQGTCFTRSSAIDGAPWMAVIDWDNWHGWSVGATALQASDPDVQAVFFPLTPTLAGGDIVTDADVIVQLAAITELVEAGDAPAPIAINMSFGRRPIDADARTNNCSQNELSCQLSRLLHHLERGGQDPQPLPRTVAIASAGNHRDVLFPAAMRHVLAAGSLELVAYTNSGGAKASWETPGNLGGGQLALMPGSALCLPSDEELGWAVPAGTSFATAITTGMITDALLWHGDAVRRLLLLEGPIWEPKRACLEPNCGIDLARGSDVFPTPNFGAADLINGAMYGDLGACGKQWHATTGVETTITFVDKIPFDDYPSLVESVAVTHRPTPEPDSCVPCSMTCENNPFIGPTTPVLGGLKGVAKSTPGMAVLMTIDLHAAWPLDPGTTILDLYLRHGSETFRINLTDHERRQLADGEVAVIYVEGVVQNPALRGQPSLISIIKKEDGASGKVDVFWHATPMPLRAPDSE